MVSQLLVDTFTRHGVHLDRLSTRHSTAALLPKLAGVLAKRLRATQHILGSLSHGQLESMAREIVTGVSVVAMPWQDELVPKSEEPRARLTARDAMFEANADILTGVRWISTLDNRTCPSCAALDQRVFPLKSGPRPPLHPGCRCVTVAELAETVELLKLGKRASKGAFGGKQVSAGLTYYAWLKDQPASFQDAAIGAARGKLLRDGGLSTDDFAWLSMGPHFESLSTAEMQRLAPEAFRRAHIEDTAVMSKTLAADVVAAAEAAGWTYQPERPGYSSGEAFLLRGTWSYGDERGRTVTGRVRVMRDRGEWVVYTRALRDGDTFGGNGRETKFPEAELDRALAHGVKALAAQGKRYAAKYGGGGMRD